MKKSKFTEAQIAFAIKQSESGTTVEEICRKLGVSQQTFYNWKKKYGGLDPTELRRLRQLEEEKDESRYQPALRGIADAELNHRGEQIGVEPVSGFGE